MAAHRAKVLSLYRSMLRESNGFTGYNFRQYALMRIKDAFKDNKDEQDTEKINALLKEAEENYAVIKRQVVISQMYKEPKLVIENRTVEDSVS